MRQYFKHHLFYQKLTGFHTLAFVFSLLCSSICLSICSCNYQNMVKKAISPVSVDCSSGHLIELYVIELKTITCGKPTFACSFIVMCLFKPSSKIFYWPFQGGTSFVDLLCFCSVSLCASVYMCFVVTCWERACLLALVCGVCCEFVTFPLVSWVRCGTWLYRFLIFAPLLT